MICSSAQYTHVSYFGFWFSWIIDQNKFKWFICILNTSNIHKKHLNLFWSTIHENQYQNQNVCVLCTWAYQLFLSLQMDLKHTKLWIPKSSWRSSSSSRLDPKPWSTECKGMILMLGHGNHQVKASKLLFLKQSPTNILINDL